jgi:hypothetical protein
LRRSEAAACGPTYERRFCIRSCIGGVVKRIMWDISSIATGAFMASERGIEGSGRKILHTWAIYRRKDI